MSDSPPLSGGPKLNNLTFGVKKKSGTPGGPQKLGPRVDDTSTRT